jgi:hypothetical protein
MARCDSDLATVEHDATAHHRVLDPALEGLTFQR